MKMELFIVTYRRDFPYQVWCCKSIERFCSGFSGVTLLVPDQDSKEAEIFEGSTGKTPIRIVSGREWAGKGMLWHMAQIMRADEWCPEADFIAHLDSDCIFTEPVTPDTYLRDGKPFLRFEYFTNIRKRHPGAAQWQAPTQACLPFLATYETMRCHPGVFHSGLYATAREQIERKTEQDMDEYIKAGRNEFPQTFCEFNTLGNVAMHMFPHKYVTVEQSSDEVTPDNKLQQFWSHGAIDRPQRIWVKGRELDVIPIEMIRKVLA